MKKILIASGCSFTEKNFKSTFHPEMDCTWDKWPELLAQKLDMDCINLGSRGAGNEYIYNSIVQRLLKTKKNRVGLIMAGWSQAKRFNFRVTKNSEGQHVHRWQAHQSSRIENFPNRDFSMSKLYPSVIKHYPDVDELERYEYMINRSIGLFFDLQMLCENFEIPLKQFQMIDLFSDMEFEKNIFSGHDSDDEKAKMMLRSPYLEHIDEKHFVGWPIAWRLGGYDLWGHILNQEFENIKSKHRKRQYDDGTGRRPTADDYFALLYAAAKKNLDISKEDSHPNVIGQQRIVDFLYEKIKD